MANTRKFPPQEALIKLKAWCDRQERCHQEVRNKAYTWGYYYEDAEELIAELIAGNYLNEERFALAYVSGKYRIKKWGRKKIKQELQAKCISEYCINRGLTGIDEEEYISNLKHWIDRKNQQWKILGRFQRQGKIAQFCINKGFEPDLVWEMIKEMNVQ